MAHFARINKETNQVIQVHVVNNDDITQRNIDSEQPIESEEIGLNFLSQVHGQQPWFNDVYFKQTSYNANFRKKFAAIGDTYDPDKDAFIPKQPQVQNATLYFDETAWQWKQQTN